MDFYKLIADEGAITIYAAGYVEHTDRQIEECHGFPVEVPTSGDIIVAGFNGYTQRDKIKANIGYMSQKFSLYEDLTVWENIRLFAGIYGVSRS